MSCGPLIHAPQLLHMWPPKILDTHLYAHHVHLLKICVVAQYIHTMCVVTHYMHTMCVVTHYMHTMCVWLIIYTPYASWLIVCTLRAYSTPWVASHILRRCTHEWVMAHIWMSHDAYYKHDSLKYTLWLIHMRAMTHSYVHHDSFICAPWLVNMRATAHSYVHPKTLIEMWIICLDPVLANSEKGRGSEWAVRVGQRLPPRFVQSGAAR